MISRDISFQETHKFSRIVFSRTLLLQRVDLKYRSERRHIARRHPKRRYSYLNGPNDARHSRKRGRSFLVLDFGDLARDKVGRDRALYLNVGGMQGWAEQRMIWQIAIRETAERLVRGMNLRARHLSGKLAGTAKRQSPQMFLRMYQDAYRHAPGASGIHEGAQLLLLAPFGFVPEIRNERRSRENRGGRALYRKKRCRKTRDEAKQLLRKS